MRFMKNQPKISIIGAGYVGLCTAVGFSSKGYHVTLSEVDKEKAEKINQGIPPFHEPGLQEELGSGVQKGNLICLVSQTEKAVLDSDLTFVTVGTPSKTDGSIDLKYMESAAHDIGAALKRKSSYHVVIVKSTVVPGTTQDKVKPILEADSRKVCGEEFGLCMNPEFLRQGSAFRDTINADRVVIGAYDKRSGDVLEDLYKGFYCDHLPRLIRTSLSTAELIKYASNAMLATKISFINTVSNICEKIPGADVKVVATAMGLDKRIGPLFLDAGLGYGGSCFPKDIKALIACSKSLGYDPKILDSVEHINKNQPYKAIELCEELVGSAEGKHVAILGLAFKPDTDDMREARVIPLIYRLIEMGAKITAYDPVAMPVAKGIFKDKIAYACSAQDCLRDADCAILVTEWPEFAKLKPEDFVGLMKNAALVDGRRIFDPEVFGKKIKFKAIGLGS